MTTEAQQQQTPPATVPAVTGGLQLHDPKQVSEFAATLNQFIQKNGLSAVLKEGSKPYVFVDGWKFAGINFGLVPIVRDGSPVKISDGHIYTIVYVKKHGRNGSTYDGIEAITDIPEQIEELKSLPNFSNVKYLRHIAYRCEVDLVHMASGNKVGSGMAVCSNTESTKVVFDEYAVASMAQTRAIAKALRNLLGFVMMAAGFSDTPAEEMAEQKLHESAPDGTFLKYDEDVQFALEIISDLRSLEQFWNDHPALQKDKKYIAHVIRKKTELKGGKR
jgi:hypothetical protein